MLYAVIQQSYVEMTQRTDLNEIKYFLATNGITLRYPKLKAYYTYQNRPKSEATGKTFDQFFNK